VICPRCGTSLREESLDGSKTNAAGRGVGPYRSMYLETIEEASAVIWVNRCANCKGVWFDDHELTEAMRTLAIVNTKDPMVDFSLQGGPPFPCLRCNTLMKAVSSQVARVIYDKCPDCNGIWLDAGEIHCFSNPLDALGAFMAAEFYPPPPPAPAPLCPEPALPSPDIIEDDPEGDGEYQTRFLVLEPTGKVRQVSLRRPLIKVGKLSSAHLRLDGDDRISRMHAVIARTDQDRATVIDLGSTVGTSVNDVKIGRCRLEDGDRLTIGNTKIIVNLSE
jgi:Zn-finger nucleic acid-binding protein